MAMRPGLFGVEERLLRPSDIRDALVAYAASVEFELLRPDLGGGAGLFGRCQGQSRTV